MRFVATNVRIQWIILCVGIFRYSYSKYVLVNEHNDANITKL